MRVVADPHVMMLHAPINALEAVSITGLGCARSVMTLAYWLTSGRLPEVEPPAHASVPALTNYHARACPKFPMYIYVQNQPMVHVLGNIRDDGWAILFIPANILPIGVAHWTFINRPRLGVLHQPYVYYGIIPIDNPNVYWHCPATTPEFRKVQMEGRACNCMSTPSMMTRNCKHEPPNFAGAPTIAFSDRYGTDAIIEPLRIQTPYSRGPKNSLIHTSVDYSVVKEPAIFNNTHVYPRTESAAIPNMQFLVHYLPRLSYARLFQHFLLTLLTTCMLTLFEWLCIHFANYGLARSDKMACLSLNILFAIAFAWLFWPKKKPRVIGHQPELSPLWLPASMEHLPFTNQLRNRCSIGAMDRSTCRGILKRLIAQAGYCQVLDPYEVEAWLDNVSSAVGETVVHPAAGLCMYCRRKRPLKKLRCAECRKTTFIHAPVCEGTCFVGLMPLMMQHPIIPCKLVVKFRESTYPHDQSTKLTVVYKGQKLTHVRDALNLYCDNLPELKSVGMLAGPMWLGVVIRCYPRTIETGIVAFACRMAFPVPYDPEPDFWTLALSIFKHVVQYEPLDIWTEGHVVEHQRTRDKRLRLAECYNELDTGHAVVHKKLFVFGMFPKGEKHAPVTYGTYEYIPKEKGVPRLINNPSPYLNALMAPYILPVAKWFAAQWNCHNRLFYAGCSPPQDVNTFMNNAINDMAWVLEDDVSMMDGSQTLASQEFFQGVVKQLFSGAERDFIMQLLQGCARFKVKRDDFKATVCGPNASGVPPTSIFNSMTTAIARALAVVFAIFGVRYDDPSLMYYFKLVITSIYMAVAGDDGLLFLPAYIGGVKIVLTPQFMKDYSLAFSWAGFDVGPTKIRVFDQSQWRLSTFLAMRPYWSGQRYEYGVEIARRMKSMFWLYDKAHHPLAWGRGVALSLLKASRHVPVVRDICEWYLENTTNLTTSVEVVSFTNPYSSVYGYEVEGDMCLRTVQEFCVDYGVPESLYRDFRRYLWSQKSVLINLDHPLLHCIAQKE